MCLLHCATCTRRTKYVCARIRMYGVLKTLNLYSPQNRSMHNQTGIIITCIVCPVLFSLTVSVVGFFCFPPHIFYRFVVIVVIAFGRAPRVCNGVTCDEYGGQKTSAGF